MSNAIESYSILYNNPFILAPLFETFYAYIEKKPKNILLSYLVLPLVLYPASREFLSRCNSKSSIRSFLKNRDRIYGLPERIKAYQRLTNLCMQYAVDLNAIMLSDDLSVKSNIFTLNSWCCPAQTVKATIGLGILLIPYNIPTVYRLFGVKQL